MYFDGHLHSTCSDGNLSPSALVDMVNKQGVRVMALTDHDTIAGHVAAHARCNELGLRFVAGVEMSVEHGGREIHVLAYFPQRTQWSDEAGSAFATALQVSSDQRRAHLQTQLDKLAAFGVQLTREEVLKHAGDYSIGRPHIAKAMLARGYVSSIDEAFVRYLGNGKPAHAPRSHVAAAAMIRLAHAAGGRCSTAHPAVYRLGEKDFAELKAAGLFGIEVYHHHHKPEDVLYYLRQCDTHDLVPTGGSDYHASPDFLELVPGAHGLDEKGFARLTRI